MSFEDNEYYNYNIYKELVSITNHSSLSDRKSEISTKVYKSILSFLSGIRETRSLDELGRRPELMQLEQEEKNYIVEVQCSRLELAV